MRRLVSLASADLVRVLSATPVTVAIEPDAR